MASPADQPSEPASPTVLSAADPPADSGLLCPHCAYNLTGLDTSRCPECGKPFDLEFLRRIRSGQPQPIPVWDDKSIPVALRFTRVCMLTWFLPGSFATGFPPRYSTVSATRFRWLALLISLGIWCLTVCVLGSEFGGNVTFANLVQVLYACAMCVCGIFVATVATEALLVLVCVLPLRRRDGQRISTSRGGSNSWQGIISFHRSFMLVTAVLVLGCVLGGPGMSRVSLLVTPLAVAWWWICLGRSLAVTAQPGPGCVLAIVLIPLAAVVGVVVGWAVSILILAVLGAPGL